METSQNKQHKDGGSFLQIAESIINGARKEDYGEVDENFHKIAEGWKLILGVDKITNRQVSHCMIWLKICRDLNTPKDDNIIDIAGYAGLIEKMDKDYSPNRKKSSLK